MTAHELARRLLEGPDLMVTVNGYEDGVDEINTVSEQSLHLNVNSAWYYGRHGDCNSPYCAICFDAPGTPTVKSIHIG